MRKTTIALSTAVVLAVGVITAPAAVADGVAGHQAQDAGHDWTTETRLNARTSQATALDALAAAEATAGAPEDVGQWGPVVDWPVVGVHVAMLPNGKVLAYDSVGDKATETYTSHTFTRATVWDPVTGTHTPVRLEGHNVFCSGLAHLPDGKVFLAGGNKNAQLNGIVQTYTFDAATNGWVLGDSMTYERWYPSVTPMADGETVITEGGPDVPEVRTTSGGLRALSAASLNLPLYPWMDVAPDGRAFYSGPTQTMRALNKSGAGAWQAFAQRDSINRDYGSHALYDVGKILVAGGAGSSKDARVIDINGTTPTTSATSPMAFGRRQHVLTVLADGSVLATGGNSSGAGLVDLNNGVYAAEQWNPATGQWRTLASQAVTRQYHSTALLLPDGRVLSAGGGICGTCDSVGYLAKNAEVFTPPYLFKRDGTGQLAARPTITAAPDAVNWGATMQLATPQASAIRKVAMVRLNSVTHSTNMEQRYIPLPFTAGDGALTAATPANGNIAPPGVYMLFVVDDQGVPSVARMVQIGTGPVAPGVDARVRAGADDAEQAPSGSVALSSSDLELVDDGTARQTVGLRFTALNIPTGAQITNAYIHFTADEAQSAATTLTIEGQAADTAGAFTTASNNVSSRPRTTAKASWAPPAWTAGAAGPAQRTPDLGPIVQEIVNRRGWVNGNAIAFIFSGAGHRTAESFEGSTGNAPLLHVEFNTPAGNGPPTVSAGPDQSITLPAGATLDGTVTDDGRPNPSPSVSWSTVSGPGTVTFSSPLAADTQATFSTAGTYVLRLTANDGAASVSDDVTVTVSPGGGAGGAVDVRVAAGTDDAEQGAAGSMYLTSTDLEMTLDGTDQQTVGFRFAGVRVPRGASITNAWIQFVADESQSVATSLSVTGQLADNAATFGSGAAGIAPRPRTIASVDWAPPAWTAGAGGAAQRTPNLAPVVQEIVSRSGWASGNALAVIVTGSGHRTAEAFEGGATLAPVLRIEYR